MRHQFIPVRKTDLVDAIAADRSLAHAPGPDAFRQLCRLLGLIIHYEAFDELETLKDAYFHFNPRFPASPARTEDAYAVLSAALTRVLARANFIEVEKGEIERAKRERGLMPVTVRAPIDGYREVRMFWRGRHRETVETSEWFGLRRRSAELEVYDDVVLFAAARHDQPPRVPRGRSRRRRPGASEVLIKFFHDIASADLDTLLPDVRVVMNMRDRWVLGLPALFGGIPLLLKLAPTLAVLFLLAGVQLGYTGAVEQDHLKQALAVMSGFVALGSFGAHQWLKYQRKALRYLVAVKDSIYFRNVNNNGGVFDALIGAAEDQEFKEALLAYRFLLAEPMTKATLDERVESWMSDRFDIALDFEVDDGLAKLDRYGLLRHSGDRLSVPPVEEALAILDRLWDNLFQYDRPQADKPAA